MKKSNSAKITQEEQRNANTEAVMGVTDHIREFRNRLILVLVVFVAALLIGFRYAAPIVELLQIPSAGLYHFVYIAPSELFMQYIRVSVMAALVVAAPVAMYELLAFAGPGLKKKEKSFVKLILVLGTIFFLAGVAFAYVIMLPFMLRFFNDINTNANIAAEISIEKYLGFVISILGMLGVVFEMPVITILLTQLGLLKPEWLKKSRRLVIVAIFAVAAFITPPDVVSQIMVAIPMLALYQLSILFSTMVRRRKDRARAKKHK